MEVKAEVDPRKRDDLQSGDGPVRDLECRNRVRSERSIVPSNQERISSLVLEYSVKRAMYRDEGVDQHWLIDLDARVVERSTPAGTDVEVMSQVLHWRPPGASVPLEIDLSSYFAEVLDD